MSIPKAQNILYWLIFGACVAVIAIGLKIWQGGFMQEFLNYWNLELTTSAIKFILSWGFVAILFVIAFFCYLIAKMLENGDLIKFAKNAGFYLIIYAVTRAIASTIDWYLGSEILVLSYLVNYSFWFLILYTVYKFYRWLKKNFFIAERSKEQKAMDQIAETARYSKHVSIGLERQKKVSDIFRELIDELKFEEEIRNTQS